MLIAGFHDVDFAGSVKRTTPCRITRTLPASAIVIDDTLTAVRARLLEIAHLILSVSGSLLDALALSDPPRTIDSRCIGNSSQSSRSLRKFPLVVRVSGKFGRFRLNPPTSTLARFSTIPPLLQQGEAAASGLH
jgi:hypothetical protein